MINYIKYLCKYPIINLYKWYQNYKWKKEYKYLSSPYHIEPFLSYGVYKERQVWINTAKKAKRRTKQYNPLRPNPWHRNADGTFSN